MTAAEEVADRNLDRGILLAVPVRTEDEIPEDGIPLARRVGERDPDVADLARTVDIGERHRVAALDRDTRSTLAADSEVAGRLSAGALLAVGVLRRDRARPFVRERCDVCDVSWHRVGRRLRGQQ